MGNKSREPALGADEMLERAKRAEPGFTARTLENLRNQGLLPPVRRVAQQGLKPVYAYPDGADRQLDALLVWRRQERNPDWLRVVLWVDGWPIPIERVRQSLVTLMRATVGQIDQGIQEAATRSRTTGKDGIAALASSLAARRGRNSVLPRISGVSASQREQAVESLLRTALDPTFKPSDAQNLAIFRALGNNHRIQSRMGLPAVEADHIRNSFAPAALDLRELASHMETASDPELARAQQIANLMVVGLPITSAITAAIAGGTGTPVDLMQHLPREPLIYLLCVGLAISLRRSDLLGPVEDLATPVEQAMRDTRDLPELSDISSNNLDRKLVGRSGARKQIDRVLDLDVDELNATLNRQGPMGAG